MNGYLGEDLLQNVNVGIDIGVREKEVLSERMPLFWRTGLGVWLAWGAFRRESRVDTKLMSKPQNDEVEGRAFGNQAYIQIEY